MPVSRHTKRLAKLQELTGRGQQVKVQDLICGQGHPVWKLAFVQSAKDLCQDCVAARQQHQHPFGADTPTFVLVPPPNAERLPDLPEGYGGQQLPAAATGSAAAADTGWSTAYHGFGPMDEGVSMVAAKDRPVQQRLWR